MSQKTVNVSVLMFALLAACIAFQLNASMLGPVLITIGNELNASEAAVGLTQTAFFTSAAVFSLFLPRLSDLKGRRKVLSIMLFIMFLGTILAAIAPNIETLFVARLIQGVTGPVVPICLLMLRAEIKDIKLYATLMGVVTAVNGGIAGIDAIAGGYIASNFGFRAVFWVIAIIAAIATFCVAKFAPESKPSEGLKMDWIGVILLSLSLALFLNALNTAGDIANFQSNQVSIIAYALGGLIAFVLFIIVEKSISYPLIKVEYLKNRATWSLVLVTTLTMTGVFAVINGLVMSLAQLKTGYGYGAEQAALYLLTPYALIGWLVGPFAGRFAPVIGYKTMLRLGLVGSIIGIYIIAHFGLQSFSALVIGVIICGIAYAGCANIILNGLGIVLSPKDNPGYLPGLNAGAFNLGAGLSFVILYAIFVNKPDLFVFNDQLALSNYNSGIMVGLIITVLALLASFLIPTPKDAELSK